MKFRDLTEKEIDVRVSTCSEKGVSLLLYKDARCDMNILDETVKPENWQRIHELINGNLFCNVAINVNYDKEKEPVWVSKQDVGVESYTEKEKGQASDSFKRACFNWGIGRELYSAPFIWITLDSKEINNGKCYTKFIVKEIGYNDKEEINKLVIVDENGKERFRFPKKETNVEPTPKQETDYRTLLINHCQNNGLDLNAISKQYNLTRGASNDDFRKVYEELCKM